MKELIRGLVAVNCYYNNRSDSDGKCHSTKCMMNGSLELRHRIQSEGCTIYKGLRKSGQHIELINPEDLVGEQNAKT